jgi:hypothetical protein
MALSPAPVPVCSAGNLQTIDPTKKMGAVCTGTLALLGVGWICTDGMAGSSMGYHADSSPVLFLAAAGMIAGATTLVTATRAKKWLTATIL